MSWDVNAVHWLAAIYAGEPGGDELHHLEVRRGAGVDLRLVVLEVQDVGEREAAADRRDPVVLDEGHERLGVALEDREAVVGARGSRGT